MQTQKAQWSWKKNSLKLSAQPDNSLNAAATGFVSFVILKLILAKKD